MGFDIRTLVGIQRLFAGAGGPLRQSAEGCLVTIPGGPKYMEMVRQGLVFSAATAAAGVSPGTAVGTTAGFSVHNPADSDRLLVMLRASVQYLSGTLDAGLGVFTRNVGVTAGTPPTGTAVVAYNAKLGSGGAGVGVALAAVTLPAAPQILYPWWSTGPILASSVVAPYSVEADIDGAIILAPGSALGFEFIGTGGSTPKVHYGAMWAEVPL